MVMEKHLHLKKFSAFSMCLQKATHLTPLRTFYGNAQHFSNQILTPHLLLMKHSRKKNGKRLIPFRMLCFSVQAFNGDFATDLFSVSIEIEYNSSGHFLRFSSGLHLPNTRENFVVEENVILPNWIISDQAVVKYTRKESKYSSEEPDWREIGLRLLLNMKIDYF